MKVLHVISSGGMYGAEAVILNLARTLRGGPHECAMGVFSNSANPQIQLHEIALKEGFESQLVPCRGKVDHAAIAGIRELATRTGADVVHAHGYKADIYTYLALRGMGVPLVSTATPGTTRIIFCRFMGWRTDLFCGGMRGLWRSPTR